MRSSAESGFALKRRMCAAWFMLEVLSRQLFANEEGRIPSRRTTLAACRWLILGHSLVHDVLGARARVEKIAVERLELRGGTHTELFAEANAQCVVREHSFGTVALTGKCSDQMTVTGFAVRRQPGQFAGGALGGVELRSSDPQRGCRQRLESAQPHLEQSSAALGDPRAAR